jgi:hypothetical protein
MGKKIIFKLVLPVIVAAVVLGAGFSQTVRAQDANDTADACVRSNPTVLITPLAVRVLNPANANISYYATIKNNDNAACEDSIFELSSVAPAGWQSSLDSSSISIAPRSMAHAKMTVIAPQTAKPGNYLFAVSVVNSFDSSRQASVTATLYGPPTHIFSLSPKVVSSNEINISDAGDLRWNGLVILPSEESKKMVRENRGLFVSIYGANKKTRGFNMRPEGELVKVTESEENDLGMATQLGEITQFDVPGLTGPVYAAGGGSNSAYILMGRKWVQKDPQVTMFLKDDALLAATGMAKTNALGAATAATNTWDDATNQNLFSDSGVALTTTENWKIDGVNNMAFIPYAPGCSALAATGVWYKTQGIAAGQMYPIVESDMTFNSNLKWTTTGEAGKLDFQSVVLHELGHTIGLGDIYGRAINDGKQVMGYYTGVRRSLGNGDSTGVWTIYDGNVSTDISVPSISLTAPAINAIYNSAQIVTINATATDSVGIYKVEFYDGAALLGTDNTFPYSYAWPITNANNGSRSLTAKAYDAVGNAGTSAPVTITINIPVGSDTVVPTVSLTTPTAGSLYSSAQTVVINAAATDNIGVSKVEFYDGTILLGTDTTSSYSYSWPITAANNGSHYLTAKAYDAAGNSKVSVIVNATVNIVAGCTSNASCDDGIYCNGAETCQAGVCVKGTAVTCNDSSACTADTCSETAKACAYSPLADNTSCASGVCCAGTCKAGVATCSGTGTVCWNGSYQNLYAGTIQMKKFCYCAQGTYSYKSYQMNSGSRAAAYYTSPYYTTDWSAKSLTATLSISSVTCSDGKAYLTNQTYTYPAAINASVPASISATANNNVAASKESLDSFALMIQSIQASLARIMAQMGK